MIAVVVVVAAAILVATGAIFAARAATVSARAADHERRLREAALDGIAVALDRLGEDRARILAGGEPSDDAVLLDIADGDRRLEVRLVAQWSGARYSAEAAKLEVNLAPAEALSRLSEGLGGPAGALVTDLPAARPFASVDALASRDGVAGPELVLGPLRMIGEEREAYEDATDATMRRDLAPPLVELLTAHGAEPLVDASGDPRLDLRAAFAESDDRRADASLAEFEDAEREALEEVARAKDTPNERRDDGAIARALLARGIAPERVDAILGSCTLEPGTHGAPRIDIVRADRRVLASIDGIGADLAARIVDLRGSLDETERRGTAWLVARRVMGADQYAAVAGRITHRSALWRFRVEARLAAPGDSDQPPAAGEPRSSAAFDCIVDVSPERPRIAYLRDVSLLPTARAISALVPAEAVDAEEEIEVVERVGAPDFDFPGSEATIPSEAPPVVPAGRDVPKSR